MMSTNVALEERRPASASINLLKIPTERGEVLQSQRSQPSADTNEQLHSTRPFIPTDLVQNTAEYLGRVAGLLSFRGVSTEWQGAVSDAVGFLNGRCWDRLECNEHLTYFGSPLPVDYDELWARFRLDSATVVTSCAVLCLRPRLETIQCARLWMRTSFPLRLLGETNEALVTLSLRNERRPPDDLSCLLGCVALREISLHGTQVTNESFAGLGPLLARLHKLDLSWCRQLQELSNLAPATSLRELNLADSRVKDLRGLEKLVALETLDVTDICTKDLSVLRQCPRLVSLSAKGDSTALESIVHAAAPSLVDCRLDIDDTVSALDSRSLSCLRRSTVLKFSKMGNASLQGFEEIPSLEHLDLFGAVDEKPIRELSVPNSWVTDVGIVWLERIAALEVLKLRRCRHITSVTSLRHCTALRELILDGTRVTDAGIAGLECIVTLTRLSLVKTDITSVSSLRHCPSLRELDISFTGLTAAGTEGLDEIGIAGLECIITLTKLSLVKTNITSVSSLRHCPSLRELDISFTGLTAVGTEGLDEIGTLQCLMAGGKTNELDASTLRHCRSLREVDLSDSDVTNAVLTALADLSTLEILKLSFCRELRDVSALARSVSLRRLHLEGSAVCDAGIAGLERIPSLTWLSLFSCESFTNVTNLFRSKSLRHLVLWQSSVTDAGLVGIESSAALEFVDLRSCAHIADIFAAVALRAAERSVKVVL
jgi:Leucine-rich repeat (LRR) protein